MCFKEHLGETSLKYTDYLLYSKTRVNGHSQKHRKLVFKTKYRLMQVKNIAGEHSAIVSTFIKQPLVTKIFVLSIFE